MGGGREGEKKKGEGEQEKEAVRGGGEEEGEGEVVVLNAFSSMLYSCFIVQQVAGGKEALYSLQGW